MGDRGTVWAEVTVDRSPARPEPKTWRISIVAEYEADNAEDVEAICQGLMDRVLEHPASIEAEAWSEEIK